MPQTIICSYWTYKIIDGVWCARQPVKGYCQVIKAIEGGLVETTRNPGWSQCT